MRHTRCVDVGYEKEVGVGNQLDWGLVFWGAGKDERPGKVVF